VIIYQADKRQFLHHVLRDDIEDVMSRHFRAATGRGVGPSEVNAWKHSLFEMSKVLQDEAIPDDVAIGIEYQLPQTSRRIDFIIAGEDESRRQKVVIVELKQWSESRRSDKDALIWARRGGRAGEQEGPHPSYQAWSYAAYLQDFNTGVQDIGLTLQPCAYLHNHPRDGEIDHPHYQAHIERAPLFLRRERERLAEFIRRHIHHGDRRGALYTIENGRIRPSKMLADSVLGLLQGKPEFVLIDGQKVVYETVLAADLRAAQRKQVLIVRGGPGTGKSVLAVNLLAALLARGRNARYVSKNAAPRAVYEARLTGAFTKSRISNLFSGSGAFVDEAADSHDTLIVDEAHRLNARSGLYRNLGDNQVRELIHAARCTVFFVDDDQVVTVHDIGHSAELRRHAEAAGAEITELELDSQFRCNGSDGYLQWLDDVLGLRETAHPTLHPREFDFRVFDDPAQLHAHIERCNRASNRARVVAGYCWPWPSKRDPAAFDIEMPAFGYRRRWNLDTDGSLWIVKPGSVEQVGCIHTCQGLELDHVGVIIGPDLRFRDGRVVVDAGERAVSDQSVKGLKKLAREDPAAAQTLAERIVRNTYRTLMSRGMKGCYVYCVDEALAEHLRSRLAQPAEPDAPLALTAAPPEPPLRWVTAEERAAGVAAVPVVDLRIAAGGFSDAQAPGDVAQRWAALPDWVTPAPDLFVARVMGESMNRRIPGGSWNLFRAAPAGTREGKVVVAQHRSIADPDTGGRYTVKRYRSEKVADADGGWRHTRIVLQPETDRPGYAPIVLELGPEQDEVQVVAEWLMTMPPGAGD
jgi:hypothetical protein